jgi:hypothetical protein
MSDEQDFINALAATMQTETLITQFRMVTAIDEEPLIALCDALTEYGIDPDAPLESLIELAYKGRSKRFLEGVIADVTLKHQPR